MNPSSILLVDDELFTRKLYTEILEEDGCQVRAAASAEEALELIKNYNFEILLTDLVLPKMSGLELAKLSKEIKPGMDVIIVTAHGTMESAIEALKFGVSDYLTKPINPEELKLTVKRIMGLRGVVKENVELKSTNELMRVLNRLSLYLEPEELMRASVNLLNSFMKGDATAYFDYIKVKDEFKLRFSTGLSKTELGILPETINKLHSGWRGRFKKAKVVISPLLKMNLKKISGEFDSFLIIPLFIKKSLVGMLILVKKKGDEKFSKKALKSAKIISSHISLTLENCRKFVSAKELAFIDELTGLYNTRYLDYFMECEIKRAARQKYPLSFLFMDVDHFKKVNDTHGHLTGSRLLIEIGKVIRSCVRDIDIIVRYGGDEYIMILVNTPPDGAHMVGNRLREILKSHVFMREQNLNIQITASFGIATYPIHADTKEKIIDMADKAMYKAKTTTRDAVYLATDLL